MKIDNFYPLRVQIIWNVVVLIAQKNSPHYFSLHIIPSKIEQFCVIDSLIVFKKEREREQSNIKIIIFISFSKSRIPSRRKTS